VGTLLKLYKNEEEAFWVFVQIIEDILPMYYFTELAGIKIDCTIVTTLLQIYQSNLYSHIRAIELEWMLNNIIFKWFMTLFIQPLSEEVRVY
jgi:hypothetical protein